MAYINVDEVYILDNTGLQVDMATDIPFVDAGFTDAQKEQARKNIAAGGTNPNLLDNPWFTVNQKGVNGTITNGQYGLDRWMAGGGTVTMTTGGITLGAGNSYALQRPANKEIFNGKTVTMSVMTDDGVIESGTVVAQTGAAKAVRTANFELCIGYTAYGSFYFYNTSSSVKTVIAAKLELGSVSTLANDAPPDYGTELLKCMRYFVRLNYTSVAEPIGYGYNYAASQARILIPTPVPMRADPTISATATANLRINCNGTYLTPSGFTATGTAFPNGIAVHFGVSGATSGALALLFSYDTLHIDFSADL